MAEKNSIDRKLDAFLKGTVAVAGMASTSLVVATVAGFPGLIAEGVIAAGILAKSIKRVPPGYKGVRITADRVGEELDSGWHLTDPTKLVQKVALVNMRPGDAPFEGIARGLLADGTEVSGDINLVLQPLCARDIVERVQTAPVVTFRRSDEAFSSQVDQFIKTTIGPAADFAGTRAATRMQNIDSLTDPVEIDKYGKTVQGLAQIAVDEIMFQSQDPKLLLELREATNKGKRHEVRRGLLISNASIANFRPSEEVIESLQEQLGAPYRAQAHRTMIDAVGEPYAMKDLNARAAREASETGATTVVHLGGGDQYESAAASALLGRSSEKRKSVSLDDAMRNLDDKVGKLNPRNGKSSRN